MKESIKFSVIIPVYNAEKYLIECIESVLNQTYQNFEIILVDDGSKDKSGEICDSYNENNKIKIFHTENRGPYLARLTALENADGEYVLFLDADDYWDQTLLAEVIQPILETNCDVVIFNLRRVYKNRVNEQTFRKNISNQILDNHSALAEVLLTDRMNSLAIKAVRRNLLFVHSIPKNQQLTYAEDMLQTVQTMLYVNAAFILDKCFYNYRMRINSSMHSEAAIKRIQDVFYVEEEIRRILQEKGCWTKKNKVYYDNIYIKSIMECLFALSNEKYTVQMKKAIMKDTLEHVYFRNLLYHHKGHDIVIYNRVRMFLLYKNQFSALINLDKCLKRIQNLLKAQDVFFE